MISNIVAVFFVVALLVEVYFISAGGAHRKQRKIKDWQVVSGRIKSIEKVQDEMTHKTYMEMTIKTDNGNTVYAKQSPMFCIYEKDEEVELIEKDGVHRFIGNDRVHKKGVRETLIGTIPMLVLISVAGIISYLAHIWS